MAGAFKHHDGRAAGNTRGHGWAPEDPGGRRFDWPFVVLRPWRGGHEHARIRVHLAA